MSIRCNNCRSFIWSFKRTICKTCETAKAIVNLRRTHLGERQRLPSVPPPRPVATRSSPVVTRPVRQTQTPTVTDTDVITDYIHGYMLATAVLDSTPTPVAPPVFNTPSEGTFGGGGASGSWDDSPSSSCSDSCSIGD
jgi:hypothetical protein